MPISKYFGGHGEEVMKNMASEYGQKKGKSVFYATANKTGATPGPKLGDMSMKALSGPRRMKRNLK